MLEHTDGHVPVKRSGTHEMHMCKHMRSRTRAQNVSTERVLCVLGNSVLMSTCACAERSMTERVLEHKKWTLMICASLPHISAIHAEHEFKFFGDFIAKPFLQHYLEDLGGVSTNSRAA